MAKRNERLDTLRMIISNYRIRTQQELVARLQEYGISINQSTLSRDLLKIRAQKNHDADHCYSIPGAEYYKRVYENIQKTAPQQPTFDELITRVERLTEELENLKAELLKLKQ